MARNPRTVKNNFVNAFIFSQFSNRSAAISYKALKMSQSLISLAFKYSYKLDMLACLGFVT